MEVILLNAKIDNKQLGAKAAAICVGKENNFSDTNLMAAVKSGHLSILEHIPLTFYIKNISRALSHQLVRHRLASYSQQSQRYCKIDTNEDWYIIPESIANKELALQEYKKLMNQIANVYQYLLKAELISKEDARMVLPNACFTSLIMSCNLRAFIEQAEKRLCNKAQWEIQELYKLMSNKVIKVYPFTESLLLPFCIKEGKCKEVKSCGKKYSD